MLSANESFLIRNFMGKIAHLCRPPVSNAHDCKVLNAILNGMLLMRKALNVGLHSGNLFGPSSGLAGISG